MSESEIQRHISAFPGYKVFLAPNTSDAEIVQSCKNLLVASGISVDRIEVKYDIQLLETGDIYASFEPPDLVVRVVYEKRASGMVKMKSVAMIRV